MIEETRYLNGHYPVKIISKAPGTKLSQRFFIEALEDARLSKRGKIIRKGEQLSVLAGQQRYSKIYIKRRYGKKNLAGLKV